MNDERLGKEIGDFYRETDITPPAARESARGVAAHLRQTPQVKRRRWLPAWRFRTSHPPDANQATDYQPTSVAAGIGPTPTVLGRTKSMFSPVKAITAGAVIFAIGGAFVIGQPLDQQEGSVPGAATDAEAMRPALVTGTMVHHYPSGTEETTFPEGLARRVHSTGETGRVETSDSRLTGDVTFDYTLDFIPDPIVPDVEGVDVGEFATWGAELGWASPRIENDAGTWDGQLVCAPTLLAHGFEDPCRIELTGAAAYEGLSAVLVEGDRLDVEDGENEAFTLDGPHLRREPAAR